MDVFSRKESKLQAIEIKRRRARIQAYQGHTDMKLKHPAWVRDAHAQNPIYTLLNKEIKEQCVIAQIRTERFRSKLHEK